EDEHFWGMIQKVKDYVAWGKIDDQTLTLLLERRGRLSGNRRLTEDFLKENTSYGSFGELATAVNSGAASLKDLGIKPIFRLHPARKGLKTIKKTAQQGGDLGFRADLADLIKRMR
ncbi:MAG: 50S ribosomal protein L30, partial [Methanothrix sp.]